MLSKLITSLQRFIERTKRNQRINKLCMIMRATCLFTLKFKFKLNARNWNSHKHIHKWNRNIRNVVKRLWTWISIKPNGPTQTHIATNDRHKRKLERQNKYEPKTNETNNENDFSLKQKWTNDVLLDVRRSLVTHSISMS